MRRQLPLLVMSLVTAVTLVASAGCGPSVDVRLVVDGPARSYEEVEAASQDVDLGPVQGIDVAEAPEARSDALVSLRRQGEEGDRAASLLTTGFPLHTPAVPVLVEIADVDGVRSLIVVEAYGQDSGPLDRRRLWVFDYASGDLLHSAAYR